MDEEKIVTGDPEVTVEEIALGAEASESGTPTEVEKSGVEAPVEEENISDKLKRADERISRASAEAEEQRKKREKDAGSLPEFDEEKQREAERARTEKELSIIENTVEERRAAMEYAEGYRARLREEKENNQAAKKREEQRQRQMAEQKDARAKEIAESIEREREEAEERSRRRDSVLSRTLGAVESAKESVDAAEARRAENVAAAQDEPQPTIEEEPAPVPTAAPVAEEIDYTINIESNLSEKDLLIMDGVTVVSIPTGAAPVPPTPVTNEPVSSPRRAPKVPEADVFYDLSDDEPVSDTKPKKTSGVAWEDLPRRQSAASEELSEDVDSLVDEPDVFVDDEPDYSPVRKTEERSKRSYEDYSSMVEQVDDAPIGGFDFDSATRRQLPRDKFDEERELLLHAEKAQRIEYTVREKDGEFDIAPKYPDPVGEPISAKEAKRREKEARENEQKALLEFERLSRETADKKAGKRTQKKSESKDEKALREYELSMDQRAADQRKKEEAESAAEAKKQAEADARQQAEIEAQLEAERAAKAAEEADKPISVSTKTQPKPTPKPKSAFDKSALVDTKKRQTKNDLLFIEHRVYDEIRRMQLDAKRNELSFVARVDSQKAKKEKQRIDRSLLDAKTRLRLAKKYETKDNERYYEIVLADVSKIKISRRADRDEVKKYRDQLIELLRRRDKLNIELIGLYSISSDGKKKNKNAEGRFNAELKGRRAAYKKQISKMKRLDKYRVGFDDKKKLCELMDERTEMMARLACINYIFKKEKPKKDAKRELSRERKRIRKNLAINERDYNRLEDRILKRASRANSSKKTMLVGWIVLLLLIAAGVGVFLCWDLIWPYVQGLIQSVKDSMSK